MAPVLLRHNMCVQNIVFIVGSKVFLSLIWGCEKPAEDVFFSVCDGEESPERRAVLIA